MRKRVLFTCVGSTDPVRSLRDGGMLHIVRHYSPEKVYIVLSDEMEKCNARDARFDLALKQYLEHSHSPALLAEYREYFYSKVVDVSDFDVFAELFDTYLKKIRAENPEAEILINLSSGSPQMALSMCLLADDPKHGNIRPVQVKNPDNSSNKSQANTNPDYSLPEELELNEDNETGAPNRCVEPALFQTRRAMLKRRILALVENYRYAEALDLLPDFGVDSEAAAYRVMEHLSKRQRLQKDPGIVNLDIGFDFYPVRQEPFKGMVDYAMMLKYLQKSGMLAEMILRANPLVMRLQKEYLSRIFAFPIEDAISKSRGEEKLRDDFPQRFSKLYNFLNEDYFNEGLRSMTLNMLVLNGMLRYFDKLDGFKRKAHIDFFTSCQKANSELRNLVAHSLADITEKDIRKHLGMGSSGFINEIEKTIRFVSGVNIPQKAFHMYDDLNEWLKSNI